MMAVRVASAAAESAEGGPIAAAWATPRVRSDDRLSSFPRRIATRWVAHDPEAAMAWLATLPAGADRNDGVDGSVSDMGAPATTGRVRMDRRDRAPALERTRTGRLRARDREASEPKEAIELAQRISDAELRE